MDISTEFAEQLRSTGVQFKDKAPLTAPWLLSDWPDWTWRLEATGEKARLIEGTWRGVVNIDFHQLLPNGKYLTDYELILEDCRKAIFFARSNIFGKEITRSEGLARFANTLFSLISFMAVRGHAQHKASLIFSALTKSDFEEWCKRSIYGKTGVEFHLERVQGILDKSTSEGRIEGILDDKGLINRTWLSERSNIPLKHLNSDAKINVTLREYETYDEYPEFFESLRHSGREYRSPRDLPIIDIAQQPASETHSSGLIGIFHHLYHLTEYLNHPLSFDPNACGAPVKLALLHGATPKGKTPTIPFETAGYILDASIKWVVEYGNSIVDMYTDISDKVYELSENRTADHCYYAEKAYDLVGKKLSIPGLAISRYHKHQTGTNNATRRESLCVLDAVESLITACFIVTGTFVVRRKAEILSLNNNSVLPGPDGWDIKFGIRKASAISRLDDLIRPIPDLVSKAASLLMELYKHERNACSDSILANRLFVNLKNNGELGDFNHAIYQALDFFCDVIEVPLNHDGRRWYLRPHELRRFFAISYYRHKRFHNLSALSWMMGHIDPEETRRYITEVHGEMEFDEEEARFITDAIYQGSLDSNLKEASDHILDHFDVDSVDLISRDRLKAYIKQLMEKDCIDISFLSLPITNSVQENIIVQFIEPTNEE